MPFQLYEKGKDTGFGGVYDEETGMAGVSVTAGCELLDYLFENKKF